MLTNKYVPKRPRAVPGSASSPADDAAPGANESDPLASQDSGGSALPRVERHGSFYEAHELLQMINDLEDERRWARFREGILWAFMFHALLIGALLLLPRYIFVPRVVEPKLSDHQEWTYLDSPPIRPKPKMEKPLLQPQPQIDQKTLEQMRQQAPAQAPKPEAQPQQQAEAPKPQIANPVAPAPQTQSQVESPKPTPVPAKPNFAMGSQNPADQLRDAMRGSMRPGASGGGQAPSGIMSRHPGADTGGVQILSDTQGVDFNSWIRRWYIETKRTWDPLIPDEVNPPILKQGAVQVRFRVLPTGRIMDGSMVLEGRSGDVALDRAAWGALTGSNYPPLPSDFHGPYIELRAVFLYNMQPR